MQSPDHVDKKLTTHIETTGFPLLSVIDNHYYRISPIQHTCLRLHQYARETAIASGNPEAIPST
ncbi:MAG: hypothetical protein GYB17_05510 [Gammaproteobacteria bacterium]|nr:hypothetical protein [Gammaproteobacteria bacterium]